MAASKNFTPSKFVKFILNLDLLSKVVFISLGLASTGLFLGISYSIINRLLAPNLTLAAGDETGESYIISKAIEQVVERKSKIKIKVEKTGGTTDNLRLLHEGKAQLVTAQADVAAGNTNISGARSVAVLYQDLFQLVVKGDTIKQFSELKGKIIALPTEGGQYKSFLEVAAHYGMSEKDFQITGKGKGKGKYKDEDADNDFRNGNADALFRVRAAGNKSISEHIQKNQGRLLAIEQAEAMKIKYPTFDTAKIPLGAYRGYSPVPEKDLDTVGVSRLLLTSDKVDKNVIEEITIILSENRQEIANAIQGHDEVKPLVATIDRPNITSSAGITLHPGALAFYERDKRSFVQENSDFLAFILTVILLGIQWIRQLKLWIARGKKDEADEYIESTIKLMNEGLGEVEFRQELLDEAFNTAAKALFAERISQESFRTFNEAYKTTREAIERERQLAKQAVENKQREVSTEYIKAVVHLLQDSKQSKNNIKQELDKILEQVATDLVADNISQESFRTFIEAYKTTRDAIERKQ
ncbi:MAG: TAXI family TRAP transporter solute-binding subunit [Cyanomargarita calcarea GSE-NOS-MK-12-04C]|uniref:TAXI family TRAP transporter solute-binding subunit n=1 Tax=Cyanomargarita calcarea GSE-NOS-MK-12-04C TaxID=2839659 RepID=A0A951QLC9_9CYAN|nr:TAXI family TRAP transporter solute-binding subunit [Cyanomargarita calcarea GSE-NOS-MK-12-04C]